MKKLIVLCICLSLAIVGSTCVLASEPGETSITNEQMVDFLVRFLGMDNQADQIARNIAETGEAYEAKGNMLAELGITTFVDTAGEEYFTYGKLADMLYLRVGDNEAAATAEKLAYLAAQNYIPANMGEQARITKNDVINILNHPDFAVYVTAEGYQEADVLFGLVAAGAQRTVDPADSLREIPEEDPASPIT